MLPDTASLTRRSLLCGFAATPLLLAGCDGLGRTEPIPATQKARKLIAAARQQIGLTRSYDPAYTSLPYPGGDVPRSKGVCTDVVIRAYRDSFGLDLQELVHEDMASHFESYPKKWGLSRPDTNIDHRRVPNLRSFLTRQGAELPLSRNPSDWRPGDIFTSTIRGRLPHIGIVSDRRAANGNPLVIHNIGKGTREEDVLFAHKLDGHYRWKLA